MGDPRGRGDSEGGGDSESEGFQEEEAGSCYGVQALTLKLLSPDAAVGAWRSLPAAALSFWVPSCKLGSPRDCLPALPQAQFRGHHLQVITSPNFLKFKHSGYKIVHNTVFLFIIYFYFFTDKVVDD